jgi:ABC-type antimicrobial peptide transport system permease subunit
VLAGGFGLLAGFLSAVGLYGMLSYSVARRRNEIGIRMTLGADRAQVTCLVLHQAGWLLAMGTTAGMLMTLAAGRMAGSLLSGLEPSDPSTLAMAVAALGPVGLLSSYIPARSGPRANRRLKTEAAACRAEIVPWRSSRPPPSPWCG